MIEEKTLVDAVACYFVRGGGVLLAEKTEKIGAGCLMGYGGGIKEGESPERAVVREVEEETRDKCKKTGGVIVLQEDLKKIAIGYFHNTKTTGEEFICKVHFYLTRKWTGIAGNSEEMINPSWFYIEDLPFDKMMLVDRYWLTEALSGFKTIVKISYGPFQKKIIGEVNIKYVNNFSNQ